jgi:hypothetical protein
MVICHNAVPYISVALRLESEKERAHMASSVRTILEANPQARLFGNILKRLYSYITIVYIDSVDGFALESTFR